MYAIHNGWFEEDYKVVDVSFRSAIIHDLHRGHGNSINLPLGPGYVLENQDFDQETTVLVDNLVVFFLGEKRDFN